jgi:predicted regulator of Ras-like GTPase activity (Roadblock/LC7/MglB family)
MSQLSHGAQNLNWLVSSFVDHVAGVTRAVVVSADGLLIAVSDNARLDRTQGDQLAAVISGLSSLTHGAARCLHNGGVRQTIVEMDGELLFAMTISDGSVLCVTTSGTADLGFVGYEMGLLVGRVGEALTPALRDELQTALPR